MGSGILAPQLRLIPDLDVCSKQKDPAWCDPKFECWFGGGMCGRRPVYRSYGGPVAREKQRVLAEARLKHGTQARIVAATDDIGYGAIAVAWHPSGHGSIVGIALGKRSATDAGTLAIEKCLKAGGVNPQVKWAFSERGRDRSNKRRGDRSGNGGKIEGQVE